jgi:hypothetical protein
VSPLRKQREKKKAPASAMCKTNKVTTASPSYLWKYSAAMGYPRVHLTTSTPTQKRKIVRWAKFLSATGIRTIIIIFRTCHGEQVGTPPCP